MRTQIFQLARWFFAKLPAWLLRWRPLHVYSISITPQDSASDDPAPLGEISIRWVTHADLDGLKCVTSPSCIAHWNGSTQRVAVAYEAETPIGVAWIATESFHEPELALKIQLSSDQAWLYAAHVLGSHRRRGIYKSILVFVLSELQCENMQELLLGVTLGNQPSVLAHEQQGAVAIGSAVVARLLGICFAVCRGRVTREGLLPFGKKTTLSISAPSPPGASQ